MKRIQRAMVAAALLAVGGTASALAHATAEAPSDQVPMGVVVNVDVQGHVNEIRHAQKLPGDVEKLLRTTLDKWITKPAIVNGRRVPSQVLFNVTLQNKRLPDGNYQASFAYVSSQPVPEGNHNFEVVNGNVVLTEPARSLRYNQDSAEMIRPVVQSTTTRVYGSGGRH
jgi:hypothetical protein